jgi:hypothetical protein
MSWRCSLICHCDFATFAVLVAPVVISQLLQGPNVAAQRSSGNQRGIKYSLPSILSKGSVFDGFASRKQKK